MGPEITQRNQHRNSFVAPGVVLHTSDRIAQTDFVYRRLRDSETGDLSFTDAYKDYHPQDRVGLVSPRLEDAIYGTAAAVLGLATGFYDSLRSRTDEFFDYPQHHVFIGGQGARVCARSGNLDLSIEEMGSAWGWLDVWPETNWHLCPATPVNMLDAVFRQQVNRVFWPASFMPGAVDEPLSHYVCKLLRGRLKSVWYYECMDADVEVRALGSAAEVIRESLGRLPRGDAETHHAVETTSRPWIANRFKPVEPEAFLEDMTACFTDE